MVCHWSRTRPVLSRKRILFRDATLSAGLVGRNQPRLAIRREKLPVGKETRLPARFTFSHRPLNRIECIECVIIKLSECADIEVPRARILERRQRRMLAEYVRRRIVS